MRLDLDYDKNELKKASGNYLNDMECFEVELIKNNLPCDTKYRLEFIDNQHIDITIQELRVLKRILNNPVVTDKLDLDKDI